MFDALNRLDSERTARVGSLTGEGPVFSAGADLKAIAAGGLQEIVDQPEGFCGLGALRRSKPLIAALNGHALAGGCELALACDLVVADEGAELGLPEVSRGLIARAGGVFDSPGRSRPGERWRSCSRPGASRWRRPTRSGS